MDTDGRLFSYVPLALAESETVLPLILVGNQLSVASAFADPDLSIVRRRFPGIEIDEETIPPAYREMIWDHMQRVAAMMINKAP